MDSSNIFVARAIHLFQTVTYLPFIIAICAGFSLSSLLEDTIHLNIGFKIVATVEPIFGNFLTVQDVYLTVLTVSTHYLVYLILYLGKLAYRQHSAELADVTKLALSGTKPTSIVLWYILIVSMPAAPYWASIELLFAYYALNAHADAAYNAHADATNKAHADAEYKAAYNAASADLQAAITDYEAGCKIINDEPLFNDPQDEDSEFASDVAYHAVEVVNSAQINRLQKDVEKLHSEAARKGAMAFYKDKMPGYHAWADEHKAIHDSI
ncbi:hypothetical protein MMC28_003812 [Mycoblastus sanguinarius]|nr:hypothetical protein [Mycoblastus sanguinarius]